MDNIELKLIELLNNSYDSKEWKELYDDILKINNMIVNNYIDFEIYNKIKEKHNNEIKILQSYENNNSNYKAINSINVSMKQKLLNLRYTLILVGIYKYAKNISIDLLKKIINASNSEKIELLTLVENIIKENERNE